MNSLLFRGVTTKKDVPFIIQENMLMYGNYIIKGRALPAIEDGMKPVYRRILIALNKNKRYNFTKSATASGDVFPYHPHGSTYGTMVSLVQKDNNLTPLLDGKGNFGQHTSRDLSPAADRYSEVKMSKISRDIFSELNGDIVNWIPNYDGTIKMPEFLPVKFPMVLHIAQEGIALGMSNRMPSFSINDICDSMIKYINTNEKTILIPDFATKGLIVKDDKVFEMINNEGKGSIRIRGKAEIKGNEIIITEIPYSTTREAIIDKIIKLVKDKEIEGILELKDITGLKQMGIKIKCKNNINMNELLEDLYSKTPLEDTYSCNMNVLDNGLPKVLGVWSIIDKWLLWRKQCLVNKKIGENERLKEELELLEGFEEVIEDIDKVIEVIRFSPGPVMYMVKEMGLSVKQAEYIFNMPLKNINEVYIKKKIEKIEVILEEIRKNNEFIESDELKNKKIINDLLYIKKEFGKERQSQIIEVKKTERKKAERKQKEKANITPVKLYITNDGYIKKVVNTSGEFKLKAGDSIKHEFDLMSNDEVLVFIGTDAYKIYLEELPISSMNELGQYIPRIINCNDTILGYSVINRNYKFHVILYSNGKLAKIATDSFKTKNSRRKLGNSLSNVADAISITPLKNDCDIELVNNNGKVRQDSTTRLDLKTSRGAQGSTLWRNIVEVRFNKNEL